MPPSARALCLACVLTPAAGWAQPAMSPTGTSQARLESDCLQRLRPLMGQGVLWTSVSFSALGSYAAYYVVSYRFTDKLLNNRSSATCTYRRDGQWVRDDATSFRLARELSP